VHLHAQAATSRLISGSPISGTMTIERLVALARPASGCAWVASWPRPTNAIARQPSVKRAGHQHALDVGVVDDRVALGSSHRPAALHALAR
jgi:hypothetical protein